MKKVCIFLLVFCLSFQPPALFVQAFQAYGTADAGAVSDAVGAASGAALRNAGISVMRFSCAGFGPPVPVFPPAW